MRNNRKLKFESWAPMAVAGCVIALFYLIGSHLGLVLEGIGTFLGFFSSIFTGIIIAYLINCPACFFNNRVLKKVKSEKRRWSLSVIIALILVLLFVALSISTLIPQLVESVTLFVDNIDLYSSTVYDWAQKLGLNRFINMDSLSANSETAMETVMQYIIDNSSKILEHSATAGKGLFDFCIAIILCIYFLMSKKPVSEFCHRLLAAITSPQKCTQTESFLSRCNVILSQYVVYNIIDALIIGTVNAIFMIIAGMPYVGLVSFVIGVTNLVPSFGPIIGLVICGFIIVLVSPKALILFVIFTLVLQTCDGYIIKPKLFGSSLGVSGMLIIVGVIIGGKIAGVIGILLATPVVAILDFTVKEYILPHMEKRNAAKQTEASLKPNNTTKEAN